ncbi:transcription initiation factor tfiid complex 60 kda subunit [Moniliophthora roreri MCA 2997]|uniref:Transcription initiation factor tfiid complex 60 kDa subunit n=1 Tax=Moniliophthora roreri (strain MCA 2997) TaxID=1381753 RepID=V2XEX4_MONRO|nr:transcription initiation factor tfiid complex 60 kda subunit [Moniliophthora roreri MCA 2997]
MSKPGPKPRISTSVQQTGVYKADAIKDVAEFLNINIGDSVAIALASDVEYRIHQVVEEAAKFMRHGRRTTLTTADIDQALRVLNIEPLYGHSPYAPPTFRRALPFVSGGLAPAGSVYFVEDEEIDFDRVLREEKITLPKGVSWTAHWLAVEGVQPLIPENPPAIPREGDVPETEVGTKAAPGQAGGTAATATTKQQQQQQKQQQQLVKSTLSRELQLYYTRLTSSLLPASGAPDHAKRTAALASLRSDAGLQALLPYLIRWVGEGVVSSLKDGSQTEADGRVLEVLVEVIQAILDNSTLFVEPYLHQLLPPLLSTLLHASLPPSHATALRTTAAQTLSKLITKHSTTYPSLSPRIMKTLLLALISPEKSAGTREGAIRGLVGVGKEAVRKGLVEGGGAKVIGTECAREGDEELAKSVMDALLVLHPTRAPSTSMTALENQLDIMMAESLDPSNPADREIAERLRELLGDYFAEKVFGDSNWARAILGMEDSG